MRAYPSPPRAHFFVCANRRAASDPLGEGCGPRGDAVYDTLKTEVARRGAFRAVWVTRTQCLGVCPKRGCTVALYSGGRESRVLADVEPADASTLFAAAVAEVGA